MLEKECKYQKGVYKVQKYSGLHTLSKIRITLSNGDGNVNPNDY